MTPTYFCRATLAASLAGTIASIVTFASADPLFSNGSATPDVPALATVTRSITGVAAPANSQWSETTGTASQVNLFTGFSCYRDPLEFTSGGGSFRIADDFAVTNPNGWRLDSLTVYIYQPNYILTAPPISSANLRLWSGRPDLAVSQVLTGNVTTNRLISATRTDTYRIANSRPLPSAVAPGTSKRLWAVVIDMGGLTFPEGTYWLDLQVVTTSLDAQAFIVPASVLGARGVAGANAMIYSPAGFTGEWQAIVDPGKPYIADDVSQEIAFIIDGNSSGVLCPADYNLDGGVDGSDVGDFFSDWSNAVPSADVNADGGIDGSDVSDFFEAWSNGGC